MTKEYISMKFSDYVRKQEDEFRKAGDGYEALSDTSKSCIDYAVQRYVDEYAAKQQAIAFVKWALEMDKIHGDNWGDAFMPGDEEDVYNQFIEQQNKP